MWERYTKTNAFTLMSLTVRMRSSSGGSLSTGVIWDRHTGHAPHIWTRQRQCVFDLPYACMCKHPRGSKLSCSNVIRRGEVRWSHNVQFCLKSEVSLEHRGRSRSPVSCARKAADDKDLQLGYVVRSVALEFSPNRQCRTGLSYSRVPTPARSVTDWCVSKLFSAG